MPPMPPMPPMSGMPAPPPAPGFSGLSATIASVVISRPAIEAASCSAGAHHFRRVDHAVGEHVAIFFGLGVEAELDVIAFADLAGHDRTVNTGVLCDLTQRRFQRLADDRDADVLVVVLAGQTFEGLRALNQGHTAADDDAFLDGCAGRVQSVVDTVLALFHFDFGHAANADHGNTACQFGNALLQLLTVVVRGGLFDLVADLGDARFDFRFFASTVDDGGLVLGDRDFLGGAEHVHGDRLELHAEVFRDHLAAGQDRDVLEHGLAAIAEARCLDGRDFQAAAQLVDHQGRQRFAFDVFGNDQQRFLRLDHLLEQRNHRLERRQFLLVQQHHAVFQLGNHLVRVGDEIGRQVAAVELHAFDDIGLGLEAFVLFDGDHAFVADFLHRVSDLLADFLLAVGGDGANLRDFVAVRHVTCGRLDRLDDFRGRQVDAALEVHRVHARCDRLHAFAHDGLSQNGRGGGAVTGFVVGAGSDFLHHLRAHVLELVFQFDFLGNRHTVLGDARRAEGFVEHDVAAFGAEGHLHRIGEDVDAFEHLVAGIGIEFDVLGRHLCLSLT